MWFPVIPLWSAKRTWKAIVFLQKWVLNETIIPSIWLKFSYSLYRFIPVIKNHRTFRFQLSKFFYDSCMIEIIYDLLSPKKSYMIFVWPLRNETNQKCPSMITKNQTWLTMKWKMIWLVTQVVSRNEHGTLWNPLVRDHIKSSCWHANFWKKVILLDFSCKIIWISSMNLTIFHVLYIKFHVNFHDKSQKNSRVHQAKADVRKFVSCEQKSNFHAVSGKITPHSFGTRDFTQSHEFPVVNGLEILCNFTQKITMRIFLMIRHWCSYSTAKLLNPIL